jgi:hypothetical protein
VPLQNYFFLVHRFADSVRYGQRPKPCFHQPAKRLNARRLASFLLFTLALPSYAQAFAPEQVVFPITGFKLEIKHGSFLSLKFGTGFCLDQECRFVGTNYHVAKIMGEQVRIKGVSSAHRFLDSGPDDTGSESINLAGGGSLTFTPAHDLAIYEMQHPLRNFHGIGFDAGDLEQGRAADIYAYPFNLNPKRGLVHWHGTFIGKTRQGLLAFSYAEGRVRGGASGGIVVDSKTNKIIGLLGGISESAGRIALAVPVKELSEFVTRAEPYLQATLFPKTVFISPVAADLDPPYIWPRAEGLSQRTLEPPEIVMLRRTAQHLADSMRNFTATETFAWGRDNGEPELTDAYETQIVNGGQRWRRQDNPKFYDNVPFPPLNGSIVSGPEWSELPQMVGSELDLKIHQAPDAVVGGRIVHVFQYGAKVEDQVCAFRTVMNYGFFQRSTAKFYDCHGEVWMDESGTILRISEDIDLSGPWYRWRGVMTYGWIEKNGTAYLVPVTITTQAENKKTYWCRGLFTDYEMFGVKARLVLSSDAEQFQKPGIGAQ